MKNHPEADFQPLKVILKITVTVKKNYYYRILSPKTK
jgi:hypothetical protein